MKRRVYLTTASTAAAMAIAGCAGSDGTGDDEPDETEGDDDPDETDDEPEEEETDDTEEEETDDDEEEEEDEHPDLVGTFDDFESLDAWEPVVGTLEADTDHAYEGSQSAQMLAAESEPRVRIVRELDDPIDIEEVVPGLALATSSAATPIIQLHDEDGDYVQYQQHVRADHPFVRHNFGHTNVSGDPDLNEITEIQIGVWAGDENEVELWVDDLHFVPRINTGRVMIQFQGGFETDYTGAYPILEAYDLTGSTFVATSRIRESEDAEGSRMTEAQLGELVDAGWSVGTVGARGLHLHQVEPDRVESDILDPLEWFDEHGYDDAGYFAFPGGRYDGEMLDLVEEHYDLGFAGRHRAQGWASNPYTITRISGEVGEVNLSAEDMIDAVDWTAEHGGLTTIVFYQMDANDVEALDAVAAHLASLRDAGEIELVTPGEIADEYVL